MARRPISSKRGWSIITKGTSGVLQRPMAFLVLCATTLGLIWLVATTTLPYALAVNSPELALWLNPNNPAALLSRAETLRSQLLQQISVEHGLASKSGLPQQAGKFSAPISPTRQDAQKTRNELRQELRTIAKRVIRNDPLNASAFRLLAEVSTAPKEVRSLIFAAVARSRREAAGLHWLLNDATTRKDYDKASTYADILLRTEPKLAPYVVSLLGQMMGSPEGRVTLTKALASNPSWRSLFFRAIPKALRDPRSVVGLMTSLKETAHPVTIKEQKPFIQALINTERVQLAYGTWLQLLPPDLLKEVKSLNNSGFNLPPSGLPFDWAMTKAVNAIGEFVRSPDKSAGLSLHIQFASGRALAPKVSQITVLPPGRYQLSGQMRGNVSGKRGLRWQISCLDGKRPVLGQTEMLLGERINWSEFSFTFNVPDVASCKGQRLRMFHDARSASEQLITGEAWFDDLSLRRLD
jgi:hypothetical protein